MTTTIRVAMVIAALLLAAPASADPAKTPGSKPGPVAPTPPTPPTPPTVPGVTPIGGVKGETVPNDMAAKKPLPRPARPDKDMAAVLDALAALGGTPIDTLTAVEARTQPTPTDAVKALVAKTTGKPFVARPVAKVDDTSIPVAGGGSVPARIYTPKGKGPFPVIVYFHGGGWVIGTLDAYDATPRALANATGAIVVAASYRQAPEHKFPAAHDDAFAAYQWVLANAAGFGGDATRVAVAGESAGGNLAINTAIRARDAGVTAPRHMLLVYPVAGKDMTTPSYLVNAQAAPLGAATMTWFVKQVFASSEQASDPRIDLV